MAGADTSRMSAAARARAYGLPPEGDGSGEEFRQGILDRERGLPEDPDGSLAYRRGYRSRITLSPHDADRRKDQGLIKSALADALLADPPEEPVQRPTREDRLRQLFEVLKEAAIAHAPCPTNEWLGAQLGYPTYGAIIPMLQELVAAGLIIVHSEGNRRRIEIVAMGIETATSVPRRRARKDEE